jgi:hypothetical protein
MRVQAWALGALFSFFSFFSFFAFFFSIPRDGALLARACTLAAATPSSLSLSLSLSVESGMALGSTGSSTIPRSLPPAHPPLSRPAPFQPPLPSSSPSTAPCFIRARASKLFMFSYVLSASPAVAVGAEEPSAAYGSYLRAHGLSRSGGCTAGGWAVRPARTRWHSARCRAC